ncbi:MAG TPA: tetratricopeptide repeat protein, partial [Mycobacteriales bacterium]|nr:tetratricopeptide repeat protein [Mycobacteriales bacterium]
MEGVIVALGGDPGQFRHLWAGESGDHLEIAVGDSVTNVRNVSQHINVQGDYYYATFPRVEWPVTVGRPPLRADAYQERPALQGTLAAALAGGGMTVVAGDGGTGKTQLAAAVFDTARGAVDLALWVNATSRAAVLGAYADAYVITQQAGSPLDTERQAELFLGWLSGTARPWVVVLDDVADPADLTGLWPTGPAGRVIVTTRRRDAALLARGQVIRVDTFTPAESLAYLTAKLGKATGLPAEVLAQAGELAEDLGQLPLALSHAAAVIINDGIGCADYRARLADRARTLAEILPDDPAQAGDDYRYTVAGAWSLARDRANTLPPDGLAGAMLDMIAVLNPNGIPETVLTSAAARAWLATRLAAGDEPGTGVGVTAEDARRAVRNLHRLSLVSHDPATTARAVRMHVLAQRATLEQLDPARVPAVVRAAADALLQAWPEVEADTTLGQVLRTNTTALTGRHDAALWEPDAHPVLSRLGRSLGEAGLVTDATRHFTTLATRHNLAYWRGEAGDAAGAAAAFEVLLADDLRVLGPDHPDTLATRHDLAWWRGQAGDAAGAAAAFEVLLADRLRVLGPDHPDTLPTRGNLAFWRGEAGDVAGAAAAFEALLADQLRRRGSG